MSADPDAWKGESFIRSVRPNTQHEGHMGTRKVRFVAKAARKTCLVPGCATTLWAGNVSCLCQAHAHKPGFCRCLRCSKRRVCG